MFEILIGGAILAVATAVFKAFGIRYTTGVLNWFQDFLNLLRPLLSQE